MKKLRIALLIVLVLSLVTCLFACSNTTKPTPTPVDPDPIIPVGPSGGGDINEDEPTVSTTAAWEALKKAALAVNDGSKIINFDVDLGFDYYEDKTGNDFGFRIAGGIDTDFTDGTDDSEFLFEMIKKPLGSDEELLLIGLYYTSETIVMDVTGLKDKNGNGQGKYVVKTKDINLTALLTGLADLYDSLAGGQSIAELILDGLLGIDLGDIPIVGGQTIENLVKNMIFAKSGAQIIPLEDGGQRIIIPSDMGFIMSVVPSLIGLLPGLLGDSIDLNMIFGLVYDVTGMDLNRIEHLKGASINLIADVGADGKMDALDVGIGLNFESDGKNPEYGKYFNEVEMHLQINKMAFNENVDVDVEQAMKDRGIDVDSAYEYSLLTFNLSLGLQINTADKTLTLSGVSPAFGTLLEGLLGSLLPEDSPLWIMPIGLNGHTYSLKVNIQAQINTRDASKTNMLVEIVGDNGGTRASIVYSGAQQAVYLDLSGILGTGYVMIPDINMNALLGDLIDMLIDTIKGALGGSEANAESQAMADEILGAVANGDIPTYLTSAASEDDEPITDIISLVAAILDNCEFIKNGHILNIQSLRVTLTEKILDYIWTLVFKDADGNYNGGEIPVSVAEVSVVSPGFAEQKNLVIDLGLGVDETVVGVKIDLGFKFGSLNDADLFYEKVNVTPEEEKLYTPIDISNGLSIDSILGALNNVYISLGLDIDVYALAGELTSIEFASAGEILVQALVEFAKTTDAGIKLLVEANVDLSKLLKDGAFDIAGLLQSDIHLALTCMEIFGLERKDFTNIFLTSA